MDIKFINILKSIEIEEKMGQKKESKSKLELRVFILILGLVALSIVLALLSYAF